MEEHQSSERSSIREVVHARPHGGTAIVTAIVGVELLLVVAGAALLLVSGIDLYGGRLGTAAVGTIFIVLGLRGVYAYAFQMFGSPVLTVGGGNASVHVEFLGIERNRRTIALTQGASMIMVPEGHGGGHVRIDGRSLGTGGLPASISVGESRMTEAQAREMIERLRPAFALGDPSNKRIERTPRALS